jgi:hypothetical protein
MKAAKPRLGGRIAVTIGRFASHDLSYRLITSSRSTPRSAGKPPQLIDGVLAEFGHHLSGIRRA